MLVDWLGENPTGRPRHILPKRLPLVLLIPDIWALEKGNHQPLGLHKYHLRSANGGVQLEGSLRKRNRSLAIHSERVRGLDQPSREIRRYVHQLRKRLQIEVHAPASLQPSQVGHGDALGRV